LRFIANVYQTLKRASTVTIILCENFFKIREKGEMFIDPKKKFDVRNIQRNLRDGVLTREEYEEFLRNLPDVSHKVYREGKANGKKGSGD